MDKKILVGIGMFLISILIAFPQGRGGGGQGGGGSQQRRMQGGQTGQSGKPDIGQGQTNRDRVRSNDQQRDQVRACDRQADGIRKQARTMAKASNDKNANRALLLQNRDELRERIRVMEQEHARLMSGIDSAQQQQWREQISNMNQYRNQVHSQLQQIESAFDSGNPDPQRVAERAREMEQIMDRWRKEYRGLSE
jgi:chromosome segregation ATPase